MTGDPINQCSWSAFKPALGGFVLRIIGAAFGLVINVLIARSLGASDYGAYATLSAGVAFLAMIASFGLPAFVTRTISAGLAGHDEAAAKGAAYFAIAVALPLSVVLAIGVVLGGPWLFEIMPVLEKVSGVALAVAIGLVPLQMHWHMRSPTCFELVIRSTVGRYMTTPLNASVRDACRRCIRRSIVGFSMGGGAWLLTR